MSVRGIRGGPVHLIFLLGVDGGCEGGVGWLAEEEEEEEDAFSLLGVLLWMSKLRRLEEMTSATNLVHSAHTSRRLQP